MGHATTLPIARIAKTISRTALCCALTLAGIANAQSLDPPLPTSTPDPYAQSMYGGTVAQGPSTRSIFVGTIAALIAQGLGSGIGASLSQVIGGSITKWFTREPSATGAAPSLATPMKSERDTRTALQAGIAFEVQLIGRDGVSRAVDPARHVFRTGDRFQVYYRPTLPGRINVSNVNPRGNESRIDNVEVAAGQLATLGPYQFIDAKGVETLKLVLEPCSSPVLTAATRGIVKVATNSVTSDAAVRIGDCGDMRTRAMRAKTRTIKKTTMDGSTAFALDPLSSEEIRSGLVGAREVQISLQHR
jgi:hypothetical protein